MHVGAHASGCSQHAAGIRALHMPHLAMLCSTSRWVPFPSLPSHHACLQCSAQPCDLQAKPSSRPRTAMEGVNGSEYVAQATESAGCMFLSSTACMSCTRCSAWLAWTAGSSPCMHGATQPTQFYLATFFTATVAFSQLSMTQHSDQGSVKPSSSFPRHAPQVELVIFETQPRTQSHNS